ncbi:1-acyl-sn-glycerol-3-phosphate acyltransferase [Evansella caseinilytica]|uniref:1-acyl-sn-glycerol-3-phosphate acyltransferase n=1 Tax=Evansella caseinilytica TaxID=1503961 RepID=A0A1H3ND13_9BACI|nr:lysophospholipid acyltransferase family protein [Evansella caseinilytica]SDY86345.1 1-acyl-sn-glycerol-3-phosphate acyltransferase [Evansella caseinilytica]
MSNSLYRFGQLLCRCFFRLFFRVQILGKENIPASGGVLLCCNHIHNFDPPLLGAFIKRQTRYMAKAELFEVPILKTLITKVGAFPIRRGMSDRQALRTGLKLLKDGEVIGIFPEGTRSKTGELGEGLAGVGFFALRSDAAVVPCAITGSYKPFSTVKLIYGKPLDLTSFKESRASAEEVTKKIMAGIQNLLNEYKN